VTINWENIEAGKASVFTHNKHNKYAPVPCAQITHKDITFTPHPCHYYVQQQWLFKQRASIAENILDTIWTPITIHFNYINKLPFLHLTVIPPTKLTSPTHTST
jgi:hypothetical protein